MNRFKLNNHGWGLKEMIFATSILLALLFIASIYVIKLYRSFDVNNEKYYHKMEATLVKYAKKYAKDYEDDVITTHELISYGYMGSFKDNSGYSCKGYVLKKYDYKAYILCTNYETIGIKNKYLKND